MNLLDVQNFLVRACTRMRDCAASFSSAPERIGKINSLKVKGITDLTKILPAELNLTKTFNLSCGNFCRQNV